MIEAIIRLSLRYRLLVVFGIGAVALFAAAALPAAHYGVFPEFAPPTVQIQTNAAGLDPREIEHAVTDRLEQGLSGLPGIAAIRSESSTGLSVINLVFHGGTDVAADRASVAGRLTSLTASLPPRAVPVIMPRQSATGTAVVIGLDAPAMPLMRLSAITQTTIRPALLAVPGVANVVVFGLALPRLEIQLNRRALLASGFGLNQVAAAAHDASALLGGGFIDTGNQQLLLDAHGQTRSAAALAQSLLGEHGGLPVTLGDVAQITTAPPPRFGAALIHGKPGLLLIVSSLAGADTLHVAHGAEQALAAISPALRRQGIDIDAHALAPSGFVREALSDLGRVLLIGAVLILVVLLLALRDWRIALISFVSIPVALLVATLVLRALGITMNTMALAGLAIALGEIVDDAVVDIENINRRLIENRVRAMPLPVLRVIRDASVEVRGAIIFATLCVAVMFTPVLLLGGVAGRLFAPLGIAYLAAIIASLFVALTLTPALAGLLLARRTGGVAHVPMQSARSAYGRLLDVTARRAGLLALIALVFVIGMGASLPLVRTRFLPQFREQDMIAHYLAAPGTSIKTMLTIGRHVAAVLGRMPEVADVVEHVGRATLGNGHPDVNKAEVDITLSRSGNAHNATAERKILAAIDTVPGVRWWANSFLTERIHETLSGFTAPLVISVYGDTLAAISADAGRILHSIRPIKGVIVAAVAAPPNTPELSIIPKRAAMLRYGVTARALLTAIHMGYAGDRVGQVYQGSLIEPIVITLRQARRADPDALRSLPIEAIDHRIVPLGLVAHIRQTGAPSLILHNAGRTEQVITVHTRPGDGDAVLAAIKRRIAALHLTGNAYVTYGGSAVAGGAARRSLVTHAGIALVVIAALLALALKSARGVALMALGLPFALAGGIAAAWLFLGGTISLGAMVGLVTLFGLSLRNGLLLLIHYARLVQTDGLAWSAATARRGAMDRLPAILITATVTAIGLLPLALANGAPGDEIEGPMAIIILGGLFTATMLTLLLLPRLASRYLRIGPSLNDGLDPPRT
ncbi:MULTISPECIES: efflux RND transporter permease subunit [Acidiphilium]|uniref:Heavy metal efflux pump, CzcA family n=1 Tax=Acidiphilium rubrum TaxID=526 RepID=A0A8G2FLD9_ACIRU|nr:MULTISPECIES: efflux RND transporter permease subunit [Acidiphilium]SIQ72081.1 heavy metal efflux pump, CzcA family [Acidiphilium rubrum]